MYEKTECSSSPENITKFSGIISSSQEHPQVLEHIPNRILVFDILFQHTAIVDFQTPCYELGRSYPCLENLTPKQKY